MGILEVIMCAVCISYIIKDEKQDGLIDYFVTCLNAIMMYKE